MWKIVGATMNGTSHLQKGKACQDRISQSVWSDSVCICLADGAGSCEFSDIGAEIACKTTSEFLSKNFDMVLNLSASKFQQVLIHRIRTRLGMKASKIGCDKNEMSSTLLFVAIKNNQFIAGHIGDGVIGAIDGDDIKLLSAPENGEYANSTYFITSSEYKSHLRLSKGLLGNIKAFFLMSDGASEALYDKKRMKFSVVIKTFSQWIENYPIEDVNGAILENMVDFFTKITSDDCSIILVQK